MCLICVCLKIWKPMAELTRNITEIQGLDSYSWLARQKENNIIHYWVSWRKIRQIGTTSVFRTLWMEPVRTLISRGTLLQRSCIQRTVDRISDNLSDNLWISVSVCFWGKKNGTFFSFTKWENLQLHPKAKHFCRREWFKWKLRTKGSLVIWGLILLGS